MLSGKKIQCYFIGCMLFIGVTFGMVNWYSTPTMSDDLCYRFVFQEDSQQSEIMKPVLSLSDVIQSQINHYSTINGRSVAGTLAQIMINLVPESIEKALNIVMFCLLILLIVRYVAHQKEDKPIIAILSFALLFLVISGFGSGFIWLLGAYNYLWPLVLNMTFLLVLRRMGDKAMNWKLLPFVLLSFIIGWTHEAITLPLAFSLCIYTMMNRQDMWRRANTYCIIAYSLGMLIIVVSPSLWNRADIGGISLTDRLIRGMVNMFLGLRISWFLVITLLTLWFKQRSLFSDILKQHSYMLIAWITAVGIVFSCGTCLERVPICTDFIAMLILLDIWQGAFLRRWQKGITLIIMLVTLCVAVPVMCLGRINHENYLYHCSQLRQKDVSLLKVRQLPADLNAFSTQLSKRYVFQNIEFGYYNCYMAFDAQDSNNRALARLFGKEYIVGIPEDVVERITSDSTAYQHWQADAHQTLFIQRLQGQQDVHHVTFLLGPEVPLLFYQRPLSYQGDEYMLDEFNYQVISIHQNRYLVMTVPPSNIRRRIKDIVID